jgi:two-component system sensor histidine kinase and response regulator WspE
VDFGGEPLGLVTGRQVLGVDGGAPRGHELPIVVLGDRTTRVGMVVDRLIGEGELVTRPLDPRLNKLKDISAGALMPDGTPVLVIDVEDLLRSIDRLITVGSLQRCGVDEAMAGAVPPKRVLVVDDSLTVRELERKLLANAGYDVTVAVDGMDGWNAVRAGEFQLIVTDVDMPRLDGIELVSLVRRDARLRTLPVMIISYKDRDEDRRRGLEAGADYYLPKASFHDDTLVAAVRDLIGAAR